jgi:hypothetical protein
VSRWLLILDARTGRCLRHRPLPEAPAAGNEVAAGASPVSMATRNNSGLSMTTVSPAGSPVAVSSNLAVTTITGCPGVSRRLRAIEGWGGLISTLTAAAGRPFSVAPSDRNTGSGSASGLDSGPPR